MVTRTCVNSTAPLKRLGLRIDVIKLRVAIDVLAAYRRRPSIQSWRSLETQQYARCGHKPRRSYTLDARWS
jgi:hypothetical protein